MYKLICLGDSTMQYNDKTTFPQVGWPQGLTKHLKNEVQVLNFAKNGRSTKSFIEEGLFAEALQQIDSNSIVLIEFGHNDEHTHQPERFTRPFVEYKNNLIWMIQQIKEKHGFPILLTPIYRRLFLENGDVDPKCHSEYKDAVKEVAKLEDCPLVDLCDMTYNWLKKVGDYESRDYYMNFKAGIYLNYPDGSSDNTHLRQKGADLIANMFIEETKKQSLPICDFYL